ncbi:hypothetical protein [Flavobacterium sp.]|uniref:hypothetical protein n=1 Tax=Flavobacterium sp. TaxID=239 RepID=UPI003D277681
MKKITILIIINLILISCNNYNTKQEITVPKKFKIGEFRYSENGEGFIVQKTMKKQIEFNIEKKYKIEFDLVWKSDNEYDMIFLGGTKGCLKIKDTINVKIVSWNKNSYSYEAFDKRCLGKSNGTLIKL